MDKLTCIRQIRDGETEAARLLFGEYGDGIYRRALAATKSKEAARAITRETILELIRTLREKNEADGWDLWVDAVTGRRIELYGLVDADVQKLSGELFGTPGEAAEPQTAAEPPQPAPIAAEPASEAPVPEEEPLFDNSQRRANGKKRAGGATAGGVIATVLLILGILLMIWVILGFLKGLNILPTLDLGYTWFNEHLFRLF